MTAQAEAPHVALAARTRKTRTAMRLRASEFGGPARIPASDIGSTGEAAHERRGAADRGECCEVAGVIKPLALTVFGRTVGNVIRVTTATL